MRVFVKDLTKSFGEDVLAVDNVSLNIEEGIFAVFLGPSGCGKTTTLRMIAGLERPDSGEIYIGDRMVIDVPPKDRHVAMVFQNFSLYPSMSVYQNIAFPLEIQKVSKPEIDKRVHEIAKMVGVEKLLGRKPREVSGGEAQRAALARALVRNPEVFLMDEPLSNLDAKLRVMLRTEIKRIHQETKTTTIYVTHDQEEAMTLGTQIVVMSQGKVQQVGAPDEVFFKPVNVFVASFVGSPSMNILNGKIGSGDTGEMRVELPGFSQPVPGRFAAVIREKGIEGVRWGIRPEHIDIIESAENDAVPAKIEVVEPLGSRQLVFISLEMLTLTVLDDATTHRSHGETCYLRFPERHIHMFDEQTERSLTV
jgi:multiple sugar transport system ATP-binding protein